MKNCQGVMSSECREIARNSKSKLLRSEVETLSHCTDTTWLLPCNKRKRREDYTCLYDRISELPDDILVTVLSRLTIKEAARTSILSSRWRYLWKWFNGCLNFDNPLTMGDYNWTLGLGSQPLDVERHRFVSWVNQVLRSLHCHSLEGLRICFDVASNGDIHNWINFAVEKKVQKLDLDFSRVQDFSWPVAEYTFSPHLDSYSSFSSLTALSLNTVAVTGEALEHLLSCCHFLEYVEIDAPNIISFEYSGSGIVFFRDVPNLTEVSFDRFFCTYIMNKLRQLSTILLQLHTLKLNLAFVSVPEAVPYDLPELCNLKHLEMEINLFDDDRLLPCAAFLRACPSLYKFTLKLFRVHPSSGTARTVKDHPYLSVCELSVRVVELVGFEGQRAETEFVMYLIEKAKLLEKIIIDPCIPKYLGTPKELLYRDSEEYHSARKHAIELGARFPLWDFVIP
ncbi:FBD domain-containing protein [Citrus sinensis]|uniref:F-box/FBD/LRR-repeat protein At1g13570-like isoform X2 n=1 Tax=Citrus sinensis TaxID=2711 RepID=UPI0021908C47|nr:F-box/FBD/LRR-repeat protein At1g13570-like isoform X2 [Citrus sinensis]KAH9673629.1 FBD domain-containing protein [Citrus sinensis]